MTNGGATARSLDKRGYQDTDTHRQGECRHLVTTSLLSFVRKGAHMDRNKVGTCVFHSKTDIIYDGHLCGNLMRYLFQININ